MEENQKQYQDLLSLSPEMADSGYDWNKKQFIPKLNYFNSTVNSRKTNKLWNESKKTMVN